jgi:isopentenyl phosphate kinase
MDTVIVKLGGAAITDKSTSDTFSPTLDALVSQVAQVYRQELQPKSKQLILIHGAGSFGHPPAKKYNVKAGWHTTIADPDSVKFGMALTRQRVLQLHHALVQRLQEKSNLPVLSLSTYDTVETDAGIITPASSSRLLERAKHILTQGFIPLLFGDAIFDRTWGSTILSGDALMYELATRLPTVVQCVFVTDVAGIYTKNPKQCADAVLIQQVSCSDPGHGSVVADEGGDASVDDVTGAMRSKWEWVVRIMTDAPQLRQVIICQVSDSQRAMGCREPEHGDGSANWTTIVR